MKKTLKIEGSPANYGDHQNLALPDSGVPSRPIPKDESGAFIKRLGEIIGDESVSAFSRRCIPGESVIRSYLNEGKQPRMDYLVSMADAGGVTVDWLATGRLPKFRADLRNPEPTPAPLNPAMLRMALILADEAASVQAITPEQRADMVLAFYHRLTKGDAS